MYNNINQTLKNIRNSGLFEIEQIRVIEFAIFRPEINVETLKLIINPTIPSEYMSMYVSLMIKGIDVRKYIKRNWELMEIPVSNLEEAIIAENKQLRDIKEATVTISDPRDINCAAVTEEKPKIKRKII